MGYNGALKNDSVVGFSITHPQVPLIFVKKTSFSVCRPSLYYMNWDICYYITQLH